jgi:purine-binding chemotaxis protein CheW
MSEDIYALADSLNTQANEPQRVREPEESWVTFLLAGEIFALPVTHIREIVLVPPIARIPHAPSWVRGVTNIHGSVIPVVDLRMRILLPISAVAERSRLLVAESHRRTIALLVDEVRQLVQIVRSRIEPPPADVLSGSSDYLVGVHSDGDHLVILLDGDRVLQPPQGHGARGAGRRRDGMTPAPCALPSAP